MPYKILNKFHVSIFSPFIIYAVAIFFIGLGDAILSYVVPIYLENNLGDPSKMGIIIACSSAAGIIFDIILGKSKIRSSNKFFIWALFSAILFPVSILFFPPVILVFLAQMVIWGLYYELIAFSTYSFINEYESVQDHAKAWGVLSVFRSLSYAIGPIIAGYTIDISLGASTGVSMTLFLVAAVIFFLFLRGTHKTHMRPDYENSVGKKEGFSFEIKVWGELLKKIWPLYLFSMVLYFVDSGFWTIGILFAEELHKIHPWGEWFLVVYMLPATFLGLFAAKLSKPWGKKKISLFCGVSSGFCMFLLLFIQNIPLILLATFISAAFLSIASPEVSATFEDYISRLGGFADDMIGLQQTAESIAYVIGPIVLGFLSSYYGNRVAFSMLGFILMVVSLISVIFTPRKIHMPHKALEVLESE